MIKVGFCVAYDWELLKTSIPRIYDDADIICLALDKDRHSWSCNPYDFDIEAFQAFIKSIDSQHKIDIYEDDFSLPELNARENCNRHRHLIAERMGKGGWHIQIDSDEYFLDFTSFVKTLKKISKNPTGNEKPVNVSCPFIPLIKHCKEGFLYVNFHGRSLECIPLATNSPDYQRARVNGHFNINTNELIIHETWARNENELRFKISNWGHSAEELESVKIRESYINLWKAMDKYNYLYITNFHPASPPIWPALSYIEASNIHDFLSKIDPSPHFLPVWKLHVLNNRNIARIKHYAKIAIGKR